MSDRFYIPPALWHTAALTLAEDEAKHCTQVMRHREGDEIVVFNGVGDVARARITSVKKNTPSLECISVQHIEQPAVCITLAPALIKADRWEWLLEKATELGVAEIQPLITERCVVKLSAEDAARKHYKWQRLVIEACKQCRRAWVPVLHPPRSLNAVCDEKRLNDVMLLAALTPDAVALTSVLGALGDKTETHVKSVIVLVGPEGDFTEKEVALAVDCGFTPVSLGPLTLRAETASLCALSVLSQTLGAGVWETH
jgi:16S rRNA (uracil1498-N3)-methyltransferase